MRAPSNTHSSMLNQRCTTIVCFAASVSGVGFFATSSVQAANSDQSVRGALETVVVTAQRREEEALDVPISISVLNGGKLDSSNESVVQELNKVPGLAALAAPLGGTQLTVRGVASTNTNFAGTSPVGYYLDSVPFGFVRSALLPDSNAYDLKRIEVMRGPQGTLYGVNAQNGVVRVLTNDADPNEFQLKLRTSGSSTQDGGENYRGDMAVNLPIVEGKLAARAVVGYEDWSGWIDKPTQEDANDAEVLNWRVKVNAQPTDNFSLGMMAWHTKTEFEGRPLALDNRTTIISMEEPIVEEYDVYSLTIGYKFPSFVLSSSTSYIDYANDSTVDLINGGGLPLTSSFTSTVVSEEISLSSTIDGPWRWSLGGIYRDVEDLVHQRAPIFPNANGLKYNDYSESFAIFGELTRSFFDERLELTGGLRYFEDEANNRQRSNPFSTTAALISSSGKFDAVSPRFVVTWHATEDFTTYASYSEGFRSGFPQSPTVLSAVPTFPPVDSDNLTNYEVGAKASLLGGVFTFETAAFYIDWDDVQQSITVPTVAGPVAGVLNGESASGAGVDVGLSIRPTERLELGLSYSWNDLAFDDVVISRGVALAQKGDRLSNSPEHTAGASLDYSLPFGSGYETRLSASVNYISERLFRGLVGTAAQLQTGDSATVSRLSLSLAAPAGWTAMLFVDNLNDDNSGYVTSPAFNPAGLNRLRPRTFGLAFEYGL